MKKEINPIVKEVLEKYETIKEYTSMFVKGVAAIRGLLISGDAGAGKSHAVNEGLQDADVDKVDYVKGSSITAAALFVKLYQNSNEGDILVLDDVDIIHKGKAEIMTIVDMLKGATELDKDPEKRTISWERASTNTLMKENNVPSSFQFNGSIIWITNETTKDIASKLKGHWGALSTRFSQVEAWLEDHEKLVYTLHLLEEVDMLGVNCQAKEGGYSKDVVEKVITYLRKNYKYMFDFNDVTTVVPRTCIKIADTIEQFPDKWESYCNVQFINLKK